MGGRNEHLACHAFGTSGGQLCFGDRNVPAVASYIRAVRYRSGADPSAEPDVPLQIRTDRVFRGMRDLPAPACMVCRFFLYPSGFLCIFCAPCRIFADDCAFSPVTAWFSDVPASDGADCSCGIILYLL